MMKVSRVRLKLTDLDLSRFIAGCWRLTKWNKTKEQLSRWIWSCVDLGITTFDLADIYGGGQCEPAFGEALDPTSRKQLQLITKCGIRPLGDATPHTRVKHYDTSIAHITASVDHSLRALRTDYLDLLLLHRPDPLLNAEEVAEAFQRLGKAGKVRAFGVSNFAPTQVELLAAAVSQPLVTNQIELHLGHLAPLYDGSLDQLQRLGMPAIAWSPLGGGAVATSTEPGWQRIQRALDAQAARLSATRDQVALAWLLRHPTSILPILGTGNIERMQSQILAERITLDRQDWFELLEASRGEPVP
jgi:predicted oxidoreductase